jgi:hypothetical protein
VHNGCDADIFRARKLGLSCGGAMSQLDEKKRVLEQWLQLPESRRRDATDVVVFAYRLLQERPELVGENRQSSLDMIVNWLLPHLQKLEAG